MRLGPYCNSGSAQATTRLGDGRFAEVENRGREHRTRMSLANTGHKVVEAATTTARDHRHADGVGYRTGKAKIIARFGAVAIHGGEQDLACTERHEPLRVGDGIEPCGVASAMGKHLIPAGRDLSCVDGCDDALAAEFLRSFADEFR